MASFGRMITVTAALAVSALVAACGGGGAGGQGTGGSGGTGSGGAGGGSVAATIEMSASSPTIGSDGRSEVTVSAFVKDGSNRALANQLVDFATADNGAQLQVVDRLTDVTGVASALLKISDPTNRTITVTASTGGTSKAIPVAVVGTTLSLSGPSNLVSNAPTEYTVVLRNSSGGALASRPVAVSSSAGNTLSGTTVTTDAAGQARFTLTGTRGGADTLSVSALGASAIAEVTVAASQLTIVAPAANAEVPVDTPQAVTVTFMLNGAPQAGQSVSFSATRGTVTPQAAVTDFAGQASATISASQAGVSIVTAQAGSLLGTQRFEFVSRTPAKVTVQPSPATVGVNLSPESANSSQLIAVVRDAADNPVKGRLVYFAATNDPSNGRIEPAFATTDSSGIASVAFYPGANPTGNSQIEVRATVDGTSPVVDGTARLTAARQDMVVRTGTGNSVVELDAATYSMPWSAVVTDSAGNPVVGATVQVALLATQYYKGHYCLVSQGASLIWAAHGEFCDQPRYSCLSEDVNENLRLDAGEDDATVQGGRGNGDGLLTPGNVASAVITKVNGATVTDANGFAAIGVNYPQEFGNWTRVRMIVTISAVGGTEARAVREFDLPVLASDVNDPTSSPPGTIGPSGSVTSPFGQTGNCRVPN